MKEEIVVKAIIARDNKFLILKQQVEGKIFYTLPGGRMTTEEPEIELKREIKEETGLDIKVLKYISEWFFIRETDGTKTICKTYLCESLNDKISAQAPEDYEQIKEYIWITKEGFLKGNYTSNQNLLDFISKISI